MESLACVLCVEREGDFKEVAYTIVEADNSKIFRVRHQAEDKEELMLQLKSESFLPIRKRLVTFLKAFNWLDKAHQNYGEQSALLSVYWFKC